MIAATIIVWVTATAAFALRGGGSEVTGTGGLDPVAVLAGAGVAGVWIITILMGRMHPASSMDRERARADTAEARVTELTDLYVTEVLPALNNATTALRVANERDGQGT